MLSIELVAQQSKLKTKLRSSEIENQKSKSEIGNRKSRIKKSKIENQKSKFEIENNKSIYSCLQ